MRIVSHLTAALAACGLIAFTLYAFIALTREEMDLRETTERELRLLGRSVQVAVENALRDKQNKDITETLVMLEQIDPSVDIAVYGTDGVARAWSAGTIILPEREGRTMLSALAIGDAVATFEPGGGLERLVLAIPLRDDDGTQAGALTLSKPLDGLVTDLSRTKATIIAAIVAFLIAAIGLGFLLGHVFVAKPLKRLVVAIGRAHDGALMPGLPLTRRDEIGDVARSFARLLDELEQARREREREEAQRRAMQRALEHADKLIAVGELTARFAHEIGSPLQVLVGRAETIQRQPESPAKVKRHATIIAEQGQRIVKVVYDLLAWSRPNASVAVPTDPRVEVRAVRDLLALEVRHRNLHLTVDVAPDLPEGPIILCRPGQFQQVAFNLVKNALAATPDGGAIVLGLALDEAGAALVLAVSDTGPGPPSGLTERLFEPFFSTRLDDGGTGLGLTIVRGIVSDHGGDVTLASRASGGACVTVRWPLRVVEVSL